jgi:hypothetical protein
MISLLMFLLIVLFIVLQTGQGERCKEATLVLHTGQGVCCKRATLDQRLNRVDVTTGPAHPANMALYRSHYQFSWIPASCCLRGHLS